MERRMAGRGSVVQEVYHRGTAGRCRRASELLTAAGLAGTVLAARRSRPGAVASALALMAGSALQRFGVFEAGVASAEDPRYTVLPQRLRRD
jgi:hypothetical protein